MQPVQPSPLQRYVVVVVQVVETNHHVAARQQRFGDVGSDKPGTAGDKNFHASGRASRRSSSNSIIACPKAM